MTPVSNKMDFYRRLRAGEFKVNDNHRWYDLKKWEQENHGPLGNIKLRSDPVLHESGYYVFNFSRLWAIQTIGPPGSRCDYDIPTVEVAERAAQWTLPYLISPMLPDQDMVVQGEAMERETETGIYLFSSSAPNLPMRKALAAYPEHREGLVAREYLRHHLPSDDFEDMMELLERYPGHVVEFSTYNVPVGVLKRRTVFWEVRAY